MNSAPLISIIIVNYCTRALLRDCLNSIRKNGIPSLETIVVDNNSHDGSVTMVRDDFPEVRLITNRTNCGFATANNQGMEQSTAKYALLLNSDTVVLPSALQSMLNFIEQHEDIGAVACRLRFPNGIIQRTASRDDSRASLTWLFWRLSRLGSLFGGDRTRQFVRRYFKFALRGTVRAYLDSYETNLAPMEVDTVSAACLLLRRQAFDQVGPLDENFFMYMEDIDYCLRLRKAGWKLYYLPSVEIIHLGEQSSGGRMRKYRPEAYRSLFYFYRKHSPFWKLAIARAMVFVAFCFTWTWNVFRDLLSPENLYRQNCADIAAVLLLCCQWGRRERSAPSSEFHSDVNPAYEETRHELEKETLRA